MIEVANHAYGGTPIRSDASANRRPARILAELRDAEARLGCPVAGWTAGAYHGAAAMGADDQGPLDQAGFGPSKGFSAVGRGVYTGRYDNQRRLRGDVDGDAFAGLWVRVSGRRGVYFGLVEDCAPSAPVPARVVVVLLDDVGYGVLDAQSGGVHPTPMAPALDSLASAGTRFTRAYASPNCSPARATLMTGRVGARDGVRDHSISIQPQALAASWPAAMRDAGWSTRYVGKWHLSGMEGNPGAPTLGDTWLPSVGGWETYHAVEGDTNDGTWLVGNERGEVVELTGETSAQYLGDASAWLAAQTGPAAVMVALTNAHLPWSAPEQDFEGLDHIRERDRGYYAEVRAADRALGEFVAELRDADLLDDTLLIVTSDNGAIGWQGAPNGDLAGEKGEMLEGGVRVPMVVHWPDGAVAGVVSSPMSFADIGHTITSLTGVSWAHLEPTDGIDQSPALFGAPVTREDGIGFVRNRDAAWMDAPGR